VNQNGFKSLQINIPSIGFWLTLIVFFWLIGAVGVVWLIKSILILIGFLILTPVIAFIGFRWWLKRNLVDAQCPVCSYQFTAVKGMEFRCPSCAEPLQVKEGHFIRLAPPGTVDVEVIEVSSQQLKD
jgi:hypothetical protein